MRCHRMCWLWPTLSVWTLLSTPQGSPAKRVRGALLWHDKREIVCHQDVTMSMMESFGDEVVPVSKRAGWR